MQGGGSISEPQKLDYMRNCQLQFSLGQVYWLFPGQAAHSQGPGSHSATPRTFPVGYDPFFCNTLTVWVIMLGFGVLSSMKTASI